MELKLSCANQLKNNHTRAGFIPMVSDKQEDWMLFTEVLLNWILYHLLVSLFKHSVYACHTPDSYMS